MFKTHRYSLLDSEPQGFARKIVPEAGTVDGLRCLVLLATAGNESAWNAATHPRATNASRSRARNGGRGTDDLEAHQRVIGLNTRIAMLPMLRKPLFDGR